MLDLASGESFLIRPRLPTALPPPLFSSTETVQTARTPAFTLMFQRYEEEDEEEKKLVKENTNTAAAARRRRHI